MTPAERAARILRATQEARKRAIEWRERQIEHLQQLLDTMAAEFAAELDRLALADGTIPLSRIDALNQFIELRVGAFEAAFRRTLLDGIRTSVSMGAGVIGAVPVTADAAAAEAMRFVREFTGADGLQLSDRLWRAGQGTRQVVREQILGAIARGQAASTSALELIASGKPLLVEATAAIDAGKAKSLKALVRRSLTASENSQRFIYERVLRTEMNRAFTEAFVGAGALDDDVAGVRFELSPLHPRVDVCDMHAKANLHGMGAGVYPLNAHPYPAHPQTLSFLTYVFADEITAEDRAGQQTAFQWIRAQPTRTQVGVLGGQNKQEAFASGELQEGELRAPWAVVRQRLGR